MEAVLTTRERLKNLRKDRDLTLEQLAEQTGLSRAALGNYESDAPKDTSASMPSSNWRKPMA